MVRGTLEQVADVLPQPAKLFWRNQIGKIRSNERRVVIAKLAAEPRQSADCAGQHRERQEEEQTAVGAPAGHDGRGDTIAPPDMAMPGGEPIESLKDGTVGAALKAPPFPLNCNKLVIDRKLDPRQRRRSCRGRRVSRKREPMSAVIAV